ncbi:MAG: hypothetical protein H7Z40_03795, partial [Phycisphaerae bacterium]|nr:hypothetical protein [Gemmatimonadaceae bacterium]
VRKGWSTALGARALAVTLPTNVSADVASDPALMAAAYIADVRTLLFRTEEMRQADQQRRNRLAYGLFATAAVLLAASAGLLMWDVNRELASVQAARAALTPQLATTLLGRASVETVSGQLAILASNERESPQWSAIIADLTSHLPEEAYLTAFRGWSDSVRFDGLADRAAAVYPALAEAKSFSGIKSAAAVRLEPQVDGSSLEKFTLVAKLKPVAPPANSGIKPAADSAAQTRAAEKGAP